MNKTSKTQSKTTDSTKEFTALLQQITSPQAREFITWILQRLTGPDAKAWGKLFAKVFKVV